MSIIELQIWWTCQKRRCFSLCLFLPGIVISKSNFMDYLKGQPPSESFNASYDNFDAIFVAKIHKLKLLQFDATSVTLLHTKVFIVIIWEGDKT